MYYIDNPTTNRLNSNNYQKQLNDAFELIYKNSEFKYDISMLSDIEKGNGSATGYAKLPETSHVGYNYKYWNSWFTAQALNFEKVPLNQNIQN